ncbi:NUDIX hydrolase [Alkalihalobacillus sp. AL-G]|uniref:NUDIX hydrolase n=1 Tax=Alkalihalobacillus sp. AL-G TaxID=2926399 RepID=UPI00272BF085|nr:NUDIX hydrolase [Alkalihalobacillus sp. AL-G]WLD94319.1 NUDIX hydrolase [Alkalihalobacillus sp. AL-G]
MKRVDVVSSILIDEENKKIVLVQNKKGDTSYWSYPGGAVEEGETLERAVIRETKEEAGLDIELTGGIQSVREAFFPEKGHHVVFFSFFAKIIGGEMKPIDPDGEVVDVRWFDFQEAENLLTYIAEEAKLKFDGQQSFAPYYFQK